ncbi:MAG: dihydrolipoyl dehydrogenase [Propionibacteriaceae bacterium]
MVVGDFALEADTVVIGSGPGGYVAAIRAAQLGKKVVIVEKTFIGGVCLNVGCIPSKALISAAHHYENSKHQNLFGVINTETVIDFSATQNWKDNDVVAPLTSGIEMLLKKNKVQIVRGEAHFIDDHTLRVMIDDVTGQTYRFQNAIIATGGRPIEIPSLPFGDRVLDSTGALNLPQIPESMVFVGGGYIGMELASAYAAFGTKITVLEGLDAVMSGFEPDLTRPVIEELKANDVEIVTKAKATGYKSDAGKVTVSYEINGTIEQVTADYCVVTVGRRPNTDDLGLELIGLETDERGLIPVDEQGRTSLSHIYAIGDIVKGAPLAHKASYEGKVAAEAIAGVPGVAVDYQAMPTVCYTSPEIATVGLTKAAAKEEGMDVTVAKFAFGGNGRSLSMANKTGFVRLVAEKATGRLVGAQLVGPGVSEMLAEITLAIENLLTLEDVSMTIHSHPTLSEMVMDAAEVALGHPIHQ